MKNKIIVSKSFSIKKTKSSEILKPIRLKTKNNCIKKFFSLVKTIKKKIKKRRNKA